MHIEIIPLQFTNDSLEIGNYLNTSIAITTPVKFKRRKSLTSYLIDLKISNYLNKIFESSYFLNKYVRKTR